MKPIDERLLQDALDYADRWVEYRQRTLATPGVAIAVRFRDRVLLSKAYGTADVERGERLTTGHVFRIASHSKLFTATAVMQLVEQGMLRLDDRAGRWLPWLPSGPGELGRVTLRQLLSHAGGVIRDGDAAGFWQLERDYPDAAELRDAFTRTPPVFPENVRFKYSNFGYALVGMVVEAATEMPYNEHVRREIVEPLGLRDTGPELDDHARERLATGYTGDHYGLERLPVAHLDTRAMSPATGFYSTALDLCRFGAAHFHGSPDLLTDESRREMQRPHWQRLEGVPQTYGLGTDVATIGERLLVGHSGGFPGFITNTRIDPAEQLVVVALTNASDGLAAEITAGIVTLINRAAEAEPAAGDRARAELDRFTGRFWSLGGAVDIVRFGGQLLGLQPERTGPLEMASELAVEGPDALRLTNAPPFGSAGEPVRYAFDAAGRVERVEWAASAHYPWDVFESRVLRCVRETRRGPQSDVPAPTA